MRLLLIEDEKKVADFVARGLRAERFAVDVAGDGTAGVQMLGDCEYDLIILDLMLPGKDGFAVISELRQAGRFVPTLMLTARGHPDDVLRGFAAGADDYLAKPFDFKELLARLRALLRRSAALRPQVLRVADLTLNTASHAAARAGKPVSLTAKEYALIEFLVLNQGRVVGREQIGQHVWDENFDPLSNVIDVYIKRLRAKLDTGFSRRLIHTRRGEGYILSAQPEASDD